MSETHPETSTWRYVCLIVVVGAASISLMAVFALLPVPNAAKVIVSGALVWAPVGVVAFFLRSQKRSSRGDDTRS